MGPDPKALNLVAVGRLSQLQNLGGTRNAAFVGACDKSPESENVAGVIHIKIGNMEMSDSSVVL